jgi:hypothetical protein
MPRSDITDEGPSPGAVARGVVNHISSLNHQFLNFPIIAADIPVIVWSSVDPREAVAVTVIGIRIIVENARRLIEIRKLPFEDGPRIKNMPIASQANCSETL